MPTGICRPVPLRIGKNQTGRIEIAFRNCLKFASRRSLVREQEIAGTADTQETPRLAIDRVGVLLCDLHTAKLAIFPGPRFPLRLDEAFELRERLLIFLGQEILRFKVQSLRVRSPTAGCVKSYSKTS